MTLLHRRADLRETMSDYLGRGARAVRRRGPRPQRDRRAARQDGRLEAVTLTDGERLPLSFLFLFLGAAPCTEWLDDAVARDDNGFILTGLGRRRATACSRPACPGIFAAGDVRAGSIKRCATAVGEGASVVAYVHDQLATAAMPTA